MKRGTEGGALSVRERIALHIYSTLLRLGGRSDSQLLTQTGIADSLLITRAHAAIELERGMKKSIFTSEFARPRGSDRGVKVYTLTPAGIEAAKKIVEMFEKERIVKEALANPGAQPISRVIENLDDETLIMLCTIRLACRPLNASSVGIKKRIPFTVLEGGMISLVESASAEIDSILGDENVARLAYSLLADSSLRTADYPGRMKCLVLSGRYREADRTAAVHGPEIEFGSDSQLTELLRKNESSYVFGVDFHILLARLCIRDGMADDAVAASLAAGNGKKGRLALAESWALAENAVASENVMRELKSNALTGGDLSTFHRIRSRLALASGEIERAAGEITSALSISTRAYEQSETRLNYELLAKIERMRGNFADAARAESKLRSLLEFGRR